MEKKNNTWNLAEMQDTLVKETEQRISEGFQEIAENSTQIGPSASAEPVEKPEPTKGVQTYIPMSMYRRLNDIKLTRGENIATLAAQAIELWLDVQEGKNDTNK